VSAHRLCPRRRNRNRRPPRKTHFPAVRQIKHTVNFVPAQGTAPALSFGSPPLQRRSQSDVCDPGRTNSGRRTYELGNCRAILMRQHRMAQFSLGGRLGSRHAVKLCKGSIAPRTSSVRPTPARTQRSRQHIEVATSPLHCNRPVCTPIIDKEWNYFAP